jgi:predicted outer membrane repeat protein
MNLSVDVNQEGVMDMRVSSVVLGFAVAVSELSAAVITVGPGGKFDFETIQEAVKAAVHFDEIVVAPGVYTETVNPRGKRITIRSSSGPANTIIDGGSIRSGIVCEKGETQQTIFDGFTVQNGRSPQEPGGGGMYLFGASPQVINVIFVSNEAGGRGHYYDTDGAAVMVSIGFPSFTGCTFLANTASGMGGGIYCENFSEITCTGCTFEANMADKGGAVYLTDSSSASFASCEFTSNAATWYGGALYVLDGCSATFIDCNLVSNGAGMGGGGIYGQCGDVAMDGGSIRMNVAGLGGGIAMNCGSASISNVQFGDNDAGTGSDIRIAYDGPPPGDPLADVSVAGSFFCGSENSIDGPWNDLGGNLFYGSCDDGACCSNGICAIIDGATCKLLGGEFRGIGTLCETEDCPGDCSADSDNSGFVGVDDMLSVIDQWGPCP